MLLFSAATNLFLLTQLLLVHTLLKITCILCISLNPYAHIISFHSSPILSRNLAGFAGACYTIEFVMTYSIIWIIFLNVSLLYMIFLCKANGSHERVQPPLKLHYMVFSEQLNTTIDVTKHYR